MSYKVGRLEFIGPVDAIVAEDLTEDLLKPEPGTVKVLGSGMSPFSAVLSACSEARQVCGPALSYEDVVIESLARMQDTFPKYMDKLSTDSKYKMYASLTLYKYAKV